jgi:hypothetical protein
VGAGGLYAAAGGLEDVHQLRAREVAPIIHDLDQRTLFRQATWHKHHPTIW